MDLVDIDELINDLERQEEEQNAAERTEHLLNQPTQKNCCNSNNKSFVGVSQVFTHLDDYEKNVETLETALPKYDIDCPLPSSNRSVKKEAISSSIEPSDLSGNPSDSFDLSQHEEDDEDDEASSDINKFTENKSPDNDLPHVEQVSSDSLTTSSSSTFSSGPSTGAVSSTSDDRISPVSPINVEGVEKPESLIEPSSKKETNIECQNSKVALEDLTTVLSSISISSNANSQSILPCETSALSVLHNVLNELSEQTSISPLSQQQRNMQSSQEDAEESESIALVSNSVAEKNIDEISKLDHDKSVRRDSLEELPEPENRIDDIAKQQAITFGSTMDEISDAELDSMLQEMDIEVDDEEDINSKSFRNLNENANPPDSSSIMESTENVTNKKDTPPETCEDDSVNADSFSQASTVEFSEIRIHAATVPIPNQQQQETIPQYSNSYTSSESSSSLDDEQERKQEEGEAESVGEGNEMESSRPQRPTTLNLPVLQSSIYTNAGQTPPGNSSMEENISEIRQTNNEIESINSPPPPPQEIEEASGFSDPNENLGRVPPIWVPDNMAAGCMQCHSKFTMIKRRHHCRACGKVLCSICCSQKFKLEFLNEHESRVCVQCYVILAQRQHTTAGNFPAMDLTNDSQAHQTHQASPTINQVRSPNPNNPMEYCSTIPPHRQVDNSTLPPPTVIVPVGVLKKDGSYSSNSSNSSNKQTRKRKSVMFSDGIAPGSDLAGIEQHQWSEAKQPRRAQQGSGGRGENNKPSTPAKSESQSDASTLGMMAQLFRGSIPPTATAAAVNAAYGSKGQKNAINGSPSKNVNKSDATSSVDSPPTGDQMGSFIPAGDKLPPIYVAKDEVGCEKEYKEVANDYELLMRLQNEILKFAITRNFFVYVKIQDLKCCLNKTVINFTTSGLHHVGNDEVVVLLEIDIPKSKELMAEPPFPKDMLIHLYEIYQEAEMGNPLAELSYTNPTQERFLGSQDYGGFIFIRPTFQCLQDVILPENPFLIGILIHRSEVPWAKVFPLRLMLRLGAQYRYYPCPHVSMRQRESVYAEIAQTIINFLADFRNYSYTLPNIRGMYIHMEGRQTTVLIPKNRQDDVIKAMNNASDHILAFAGNFSKAADGHLVCMQNTNDDRSEMFSYSTQAINIQGQPRKVTGASFFVLNESLKSTSGLLAKCSIVEDGLMVQILPSKMEEVRNSLTNQKDIEIICGPANAEEEQREIVIIKWVDNDKDFNIGVKSPIDEKSFEGISSMRVHASFNYANANYLIRLTDIFILKFDDWYYTQAKSGDITRIAEHIARSASMALVPFLDSMASDGNRKIGIRTTLHQDNVCYEAGACGSKLSPIYMNALDNNLIPILHNESTGIEEAIILELIFYILNA